MAREDCEAPGSVSIDYAVSRRNYYTVHGYCEGDRGQQLEVCFSGFAAANLAEGLRRGEYFVPYAQHSRPSSLGEDAQLARNLWDLSEKIIKEKTGYEQTV
jgi:hypothetical protein